jgi:YfiH family protein
VVQNRDSLLERFDGNVRLQWLEQVHGTDVVEATVVDATEVIRADACYSSQPGIACCVTTADCLPVLITNKTGDMVAGVHAGWRGLSAGILERTLEKFSCSPDDIFVWFGPAIGPCHFEVGADVKKAYLTNASNEIGLMLEECFVPTEIPGKFMANLYGLAKIKLSQFGVTNISGGEFCTFCDESNFYSYRRQSETGRMVSLIYIKP